MYTPDNVQQSAGPDAMAATPYDGGLANRIEVASRGGVSQQQIDLLTSRVTGLVKDMRAAGASDVEIRAAAGQLAGGNPELATIASDMAQKQLDPDKFNLFAADRNNHPQAPTILDDGVDRTGAAYTMDTTAVLALLTQGGNGIPRQEVPNLALGQGQNRAV